jgi:putative N6-adenine-specific DNA methylase
MNWSNFNSGLWKGILKQRSGTSSSVVPTIYGSDRDVGAIEIANANASRAGISNMITFCHHALSDLKDLKGWRSFFFYWLISRYGGLDDF